MFGMFAVPEFRETIRHDSLSDTKFIVIYVHNIVKDLQEKFAKICNIF